MSDSSTGGVDPRFDPRFQRGYSDAAADAPAAPPSSHPPRVRGAAPAPPPADDAAARLLEAMKRTARPIPPEHEHFAPDGRSVPSPAPLAGASAQPTTTSGRAAESRDGSTDRDSASVVWFDESGAASTRSADPWILGAWALSAVALALGAGLFLAAVMGEDPYGGGNLSDRWLQYAGWTIAPSLVQGGLLGIVGMLVWTGVRHARLEARRGAAPGVGDAA